MPLKNSWEAIQICKCPLWKVELLLSDWERQTEGEVGWVDVIIFDKLNYHFSATVMGSAQTMEKWLCVLSLWSKWIREEITKFLEPGNLKAGPDPRLWKTLWESWVHVGLTHLARGWQMFECQGQRDGGSPLRWGAMFSFLWHTLAHYTGTGHCWFGECFILLSGFIFDTFGYIVFSWWWL